MNCKICHFSIKDNEETKTSAKVLRLSSKALSFSCRISAIHLVCCLMSVMIPISSVLAQHDHENTTLIGRWANGHYRTVAARENLAYFNNGAILLIFDFSDPEQPEELSRIILPTLFSDIAIEGRYAYLCVPGYGLNIIDIADPTDPILLGSSEPTKCQRVSVRGNHAYVVRNDEGLKIIDVSDPERPVQISHWETEGLAGDVTIHNNFAYLLDNTEGLIVLDISDPENPSEAGIFPIENDARRGLKCIEIIDGYAYVGDRFGIRVIDVSDHDDMVQVNHLIHGFSAPYEIEGGDRYLYSVSGSDIPRGLYVIDVDDPRNPVVIARPDSSVNTSDLAVSGELVFTTGAERGLQVFDVSDPERPTRMSRHDESANSLNVDVNEDYAFIVGYDYLHIIDISDPSNPTRLSALETYNPGPTWSHNMVVTVAEDYAYVGAGSKGMYIVDVSDPEHPEEVSRFDPGIYADDIVVRENVAYIPSSVELWTVDITDPTNPEEMDSHYYGGGMIGPFRIEVAGEYAFIAGFVYGLLVYNISDPSNIRTTCVYGGIGFVSDVSIVGQYAIIANGLNGIKVIDISRPANPRVIGSYNEDEFNGGSISAVGDYAYVCDEFDGFMWVIDISDPFNPTKVGYYDTGHWASGVTAKDNFAFVADCKDGLYIIRNDNNVGVDYSSELLPAGFKINSVYPNPFNSTTTIRYGLPHPSHVSLQVYNPLGHRISTLFEGYRQPGIHTTKLTATDLPSGLYFVQLNAGMEVMTQKVMLIK